MNWRAQKRKTKVKQRENMIEFYLIGNDKAQKNIEPMAVELNAANAKCYFRFDLFLVFFQNESFYVKKSMCLCSF